MSLSFKRDGVPPDMEMNRPKKQTLGSFRKKSQEADCQINQTETYSLWKFQAEGTIKELKKGAGRKMVGAGAPKLITNSLCSARTRAHTSLKSTKQDYRKICITKI